MTECPLANQVAFPSPEQESVRDYTSHRAQRPVLGRQVLNHLLILLSSHLESQLSTSRTSLFSPALLLSICAVLQVNCSPQQDVMSALPLVVGRLRDWRVLEPHHRYSSEGVHKLALDLAGIVDEASASTRSDASHPSHGRLRMKWVGLDPPSENLGGIPSRSTSTSSSASWSGVLDSAPKCAHVDVDRRRFGTAHGSCLSGRLGTPDSEDTTVSRHNHAASGFRSGCSACRHPRVSGSSTPPSPLMTSIGQRTPFGDANQPYVHVSTSILLPRYPKVTEQRATTKRPKKESNASLPSVPRGAHIDENEPPFSKRVGALADVGLGITFPRQRTYPPRMPNASSSQLPYSPAVTSQRRMQPSRLPNRTREGDKRTSSHRPASASVDLVLPIARHVYSSIASPIDLHPQPNRAQSLSCTSVTPRTPGSVVRNPKLSSNPLSRSGKLLPFWSQTHRRDSSTTTTTTTTRSALLKPNVSLPSAAKAHSQNVHSSVQSPRPWIPSDTRGASRCSVPSQIHRHTKSASAALPSPRLATRKWQV